MKKKLFWPVVFCGILVALTLGTEKAQAALGIIPIGGNFTLTNTDGKKVSLSDFDGQIVLLFFGYTNCADICPAGLSKLQTVRNQLGDKASHTQIIFITVDPERDTREKLKAYVAYFGPTNIGLTGEPQEIAEVAAKYRMSYKKTGSAEDYAVDHGNFIYLIDTQGRTRSLYRSTTPVKKMVSDILSLIN